MFFMKNMKEYLNNIFIIYRSTPT